MKVIKLNLFLKEPDVISLYRIELKLIQRSNVQFSGELFFRMKYSVDQ